MATSAMVKESVRLRGRRWEVEGQEACDMKDKYAR